MLSVGADMHATAGWHAATQFSVAVAHIAFRFDGAGGTPSAAEPGSGVVGATSTAQAA